MKKEFKMFRYQLYVTSPSLLQWAVDGLKMPVDKVISATVALNGHLNVLQWARAQDPPCAWDVKVCSNAVRNRRVHVLKWLRDQDIPASWWVLD